MQKFPFLTITATADGNIPPPYTVLAVARLISGESIISESSGCPCLITLSNHPLGKIMKPSLYQGVTSAFERGCSLSLIPIMLKITSEIAFVPLSNITLRLPQSDEIRG